MDERKFNIAGLIGFAASGICFAAVGLQADDLLTVLGSTIWIAACIVWLVPLVFRSRKP